MNLLLKRVNKLKIIAFGILSVLLFAANANATIMTTVQASRIFDPGGVFQFEVNDFAGTPGTSPGWDFLVLTPGGLNITATPLNPFTIDLTSLTSPGQLSGMANNFDENAASSLIFVNAIGGITGFDADSFVVNSANFQNPFVGSFNVGLGANPNSLVLNYDPTPVASIPEPSTWAMMAMGTFFLALCHLRRKKKMSQLAALGTDQ